MTEALGLWNRKKKKKKRKDWRCTSLLVICFPIILLIEGAVAVSDQGEALVSWKETFGRPVPELSNWNPADFSPCKWFGVTCDSHGRVVELSIKYVDLGGGAPSNVSSLMSLTSIVLPGTNLSGPIPPQLGSLPALVTLDLSGNDFTGKIPPELFSSTSKIEKIYLNSNRLQGSIPGNVGNLTSLKWLVIYDNQLDGVIPPSIGNLIGLEVLRAGGNKNLHSSLPPEIGDCAELTMLGLAETSISGILPRELGKLKKLETLAIYTALLSGPIPSELGQCEQLQNIYLYENSLSGSLPPELGGLQKLRNLLLWQNSLVGVIPPELGGCFELTVVDLSMNMLTGELPRTIGNLTNLQQLQLSVNQISGSIPADLANCGNLTDLELDNNLIGGTIPEELGRLRNLKMLYLWQNKLEGGIPLEIGDCQNLEAVDFSQNSLVGMIPKGIFQLPHLNKLLLLSNNLSGEIPPEIGNCTSLIRFRANDNRIVGVIPREIGMLKKLSFIDLGNNKLSGGIPGEISGCSNLTFLDLHSNQLTGTLPSPALSNLSSLQLLDLSDNLFTGPINGGIGSLTFLTKLILSKNKFSGVIPLEIGSCEKLQLLDLSVNSFSGVIPFSIGKLPSLEIALNLSWNNLSGSIPPEFAGLVRLGVLDLSHNSISGDLVHLSGLQNLVALNISYNNFSGQLPYTPFFTKLPISDIEGNPSLCVSSLCSGAYQIKTRSVVGRVVARIATAILLSAACVLFVAAAVVFSRMRRTCGSHKDQSEGNDDVEMGSPWEVTLYQKLDISIADVAKGLNPTSIIGRGWSGTVYRATIPSGLTIAVKRFRTCDDAAIAAFGCEIEALARVRHRNIVKLLGWGANRKTRLLFYDYLPNGTLGEILHGGSPFEWETRLDVALGLAEGLSYLHHDCVPAILHRDVKPENVLLGERYEACLADFGLARVIDECGHVDRSQNNPPHLAGSFGYMAPEYGCMMRITRKSDVYSYGVVLLEIITGKMAVDGGCFGEEQGIVSWAREHLRKKRDPVEIIDGRMRGRTDTQVQEMLQVLGIALLCCSNRVDDRPTMKDVAALLQEIRHDNRGDANGGDLTKKKRSGSDSWRRGGMPETPEHQQKQQEFVLPEQQGSLPFSTSNSYNFNL